MLPVLATVTSRSLLVCGQSLFFRLSGYFFRAIHESKEETGHHILKKLHSVHRLRKRRLKFYLEFSIRHPCSISEWLRLTRENSYRATTKQRHYTDLCLDLCNPASVVWYFLAGISQGSDAGDELNAGRGTSVNSSGICL